MVDSTPQKLIEELNYGSTIYKSDKHKILGIDKETN